MKRRGAMVAAVLAAAACLNTNAPTSFVFRYAFFAYGCDTSCDTPGDTAISSAARGDTVWLSHVVELLGAIDSVHPQAATLRPDCAVNVLVVKGSDTARSVPNPATCPDSTYSQLFTLAGITFPSSVSRYTRWIVDSGVAPGAYGLIGRVMVQPRLLPTFTFTIQ